MKMRSMVIAALYNIYTTLKGPAAARAGPGSKDDDEDEWNVQNAWLDFPFYSRREEEEDDDQKRSRNLAVDWLMTTLILLSSIYYKSYHYYFSSSSSATTAQCSITTTTIVVVVLGLQSLKKFCPASEQWFIRNVSTLATDPE